MFQNVCLRIRKRTIHDVLFLLCVLSGGCRYQGETSETYLITCTEKFAVSIASTSSDACTCMSKVVN